MSTWTLIVTHRGAARCCHSRLPDGSCERGGTCGTRISQISLCRCVAAGILAHAEPSRYVDADPLALACSMTCSAN